LHSGSADELEAALTRIMATGNTDFQEDAHSEVGSHSFDDFVFFSTIFCRADALSTFEILGS
jgi:hypothetical protein